MVHFLLLPKTQEDRPMEKFILLFVGFVAFTGLTNGAGLLPDNMMAEKGGTVNFTTVSPPDGPFLGINWLFGNKPIIVATPGSGTPAPDYEGRITFFPDTGSLELRNLSPSDSGEYTVRIITAAAEHTGTTTLEVVERISNPSITLTNVAIEGNNLNLTCETAGSMLTRKWLKDGSDLTLSDNITLDDDNRVLSFQPLNRADRGVYSCNITNPINTMEAKYNLVVNYGPDKAQIKGENKINSGETFTLTCSAESEPSASFTWILNGKVVHSSAEYKKKAEPSDGGNYTCQAKNSKTGRSSSAMHGLTVIERISNPSITLTNVAIEGNNLNLICDAAGSLLTRKWLKDGSDLTLSDNITLDDDNRVLSFQPLNRADRGVYSCNITNPINTMEAEHTLVVNYGPDKAQIKGESKINSSDTFTLTCSAESEPSASFTWILNGKVVHSSAEYKKKAEPSDSGNYTCQAKNSKTGRSSSATHGLTVIGSNEPTGGCGGGCIAGIVIAVLVVIGAAGGGGYYVYKKKKSRKQSPTPRGGRDGGQDNTNNSGNKELNYADVRVFHKKDGDAVQLGTQNETTEYAQVRGSNNPPAAASLPDYDAHMQRNRRLAPQPDANGAQLYSQIRKN
ncbi:carcinoembryonic antigen-related cell adhesion molecule 5-like isoform X1 [Cheilinus undulatus]|uniref:carcinoembryonic antigen-related cell adhesion molecule 5-like isoform X1 n=1 Tax=Cheilinus undulatus TaxID=241271 RepID=UPI001BD50C55|nr:carcinoembryonic antigen-related cell adhesion molecule 5-like isoform X1 [Cheilinus undulatus]